VLVLRDQQPLLHYVNIQLQKRQSKSGCPSFAEGGGLVRRRGDDCWQ
jgi:hypothetical protein